MSTHFFLSSSHARPSSRWREAFLEGKTRDLPAIMQAAAPLDVIWVPAADPFWDQALVSLHTMMVHCPVVVLSASPGSHEAARALDLGARGYCHSHAVPALLREVSVVVTHGGLWIGPELMARVMKAASRILPKRPDPALTELLSERESQVVEAVVAGSSNKEVASRLGITERTVKAHLGSVFRKLDVRDRLQLVLRLADERTPVI